MTAPSGCARMVDVSAAQSSVDWDKVAASGVTLASVEVGIGNDQPNSLRVVQSHGARASGLVVRAYHFAYPLPPDGVHAGRDPVQQAQIHWSATEALQLAESTLDLEWPTDFTKWSDSASYVRGWALAYLAEYERLSGVVPWLYASPGYLEQIGAAEEPALARSPLWVAQWDVESPMTPAPWDSWAAWQMTATGHVDGIIGPVDLSLVRPCAVPTQPDVCVPDN